MFVRPGAVASLTLLAGLAAGQYSPRNAAVFARDTAPPGQSFAFDLNSGPELQLSTDEKPATEMSFSTEGGVPYSQPYDAQRLGSDGEWSAVRGRRMSTLTLCPL